jgi:folate-binding protein YgfZ
MQTQWQQFLLTQGAQLDTQDQLTFANAAEAIDGLDTSGVICTLDHLGCIHVSGPDAQTFLQGQFSNDIKQLQNTQGQISAYCNPKGRMLAHLLVMPDNDEFLLLLPRAILEPTLKRLRMFVLRSQVTLTDASDERVCLGLAGKTIADKLSDTMQLPGDDYQVSRSDTSVICKLPAPHPRFLFVAGLEQATSLWTNLSPQLLATDQHVWHWLDIQAGLPSIWPQTVEEFVPQMVNLDLIDGVNFKKGCYPGQEIVARMHYLGKPKRRMYHLTLDQAEPPVPGTDIYVAGGDGQSAGKIVLAESRQQDTECLAVIQNDKVHAELRLKSGDGPKLTMAKLPYSVESA